MGTIRHSPASAAWEQSRQTTLVALAKIDDSTLLELTKLSLPEIQAIKEEIAQVFPAGNLPAFVLSGLVKLKGRLVNPEQVSQDLTALFRGINLIPQSLYGVFFAGPATVLYAYQKLLELAGKDPAGAFPQGPWQFYLQFGLREDAARHVNETIGFQAATNARSPQAADARMAAAWVCAALDLLYRYDDLLAVDWTERVMLRLLAEEAREAGLGDKPPLAALTADWNRQRPYAAPDQADYISHREQAFYQFLQERLAVLPAHARERLNQRYTACLAQELGDYQEQMSILSFLEPDRYQEHKQPIPLWQAAIAFVWQDGIYLLPACQRDEQGSPLCFRAASSDQPVDGPAMPLYALAENELCDAAHQPLRIDRRARIFYRDTGQLAGRLRPPAPEVVLGWLAAILAGQANLPLKKTAPLDALLAASPRALQPQLRSSLPEATRAELEALRRAPLVINWDGAPSSLPLAYIRRGRRGIGDHAMTIFRASHSFVFDQSHIFFDGMWGMAVAEILTNSAASWHRRLAEQAAALLPASPAPLALSAPPEVEAMAQCQRAEMAAESDGVDVHRLARLRQWLAQRGVRLTVNDLLLLYRSLHAARYEPSPAVRRALKDFASRADSAEAQAALKSIESTLARFKATNPALLIPMDASNVSPRERIFPTIFRNPLTQIPDRLARTHKLYAEQRAHPDAVRWRAFDRSRRELLAYLKAFGEFLDALKAVTMRGESFNTATIRLLAHLPASMQALLDQIPQRIGVLNEIIKGNEVFSNVGRVAPGSSLTRFTSAKDDGQTKELIWGILTDDQNKLRISLRDFRPFVPLLLALGEDGLAEMLARDYLDSYVKGLNRFLIELGGIVSAKSPDK